MKEQLCGYQPSRLRANSSAASNICKRAGFSLSTSLSNICQHFWNVSVWNESGAQNFNLLIWRWTRSTCYSSSCLVCPLRVICLDIAHNPPPPTPPTHPLHPSHTRGWVVNWWWWMWWWWCVCYVIKAPPNPTTPFTCNCLDITMCNVPSNPTTICSPPLYPAPLLSWVSYLTLPPRNDKVS